MNYPNQRSSSRRDMLSRLGESTASMLTFDDLRGGPQSSPAPTNNPAAHRHNQEECPERVHRSPLRRSPPGNSRKPLGQVVRGRPHKLLSPTKSSGRKKAPPPSTPAKARSHDSECVSKPARPGIFLPSLEVDDTIPSEITAPSPRQPNNACTGNRNTIEIGDGVYVPLCGVQETLDALHGDLCTQSPCLLCENFLFHVESADMVLCPDCRSISPVAVSTPTGRSSSSGKHSSSSEESLVGMGLTVEYVVAELQKVRLE